MARRTLAAASLAAVILSGCGSSAPSAPPTERPSPITTASAAAAAPSPTGTPSPTATPDPVKALQAAVVQIQLTGPFSEPGHAPGRFVRSGSGFFVDPSGLVLTNNHVATGAGKLTVWVGPDRTEHAAQVVGASECSDLALLKVAGDGPFTALDWYEGDIGPGLAIYAAGYPLGDPEFTLTSGIVSRARGVIDEAWASVDHTIEHDATINPGSSGGPVVTHDGQVVGVNYAERDSTRQQFAIGREDARAILPELTAGHDVASIGIHGEVTDADLGTGVWVDAVRPDSPAAEAGIEPGNVITSLDGVDLGDDHTLKTYCDILRRHQPEDVLGVEVMRDQDVAPVDGQINGEPLSPPFSFARLLADGPTVDPVDQAVAEVHDLLETITFDAPADWRDVEDQDWTFGGEVVGPGVLVSTDSTTFRSGWETPGVYVAARFDGDRTPDEILDAYRPKFRDSCSDVKRAPFALGGWSGSYDLWTGCGGTATRFLTIAGQTENESSTIFLQAQAVTDDDLVALDRILATIRLEP